MTEKPSSPNQIETVIRILRLTGAAFLLFGLLIFSNLGGVAGLIGIDGQGINQIVGACLMMVGLVDIVLVPRLLQGKTRQ